MPGFRTNFVGSTFDFFDFQIHSSNSKYNVLLSKHYAFLDSSIFYS